MTPVDDAPVTLEEPALGAAAPRPAALSEDGRCPLCDYQLRGLTEPRCPECGSRFEWADFTDPSRKLHPYLFEHHRRRSLWSFVRTYWGGLRPRRFWTSLRPSQPSRPRRLVLYWTLASLLLPVAYFGAFVYSSVAYMKEHDVNRRKRLQQVNAYFATYGYDPSPGSVTEQIRNAGGARAWVDETLPPPGSPAYFSYVHRRFFERDFGEHFAAVLIYAAWPWLMLATLMIFRASMRRAEVRTVHVLRCALYSCDAGLWLGALALLAVPPLVHRLDLGRYIGFRDVAVASVLFAGVTGWRAAAAYRHYLQLDRPVATSAAVQVVVLLAVWVFLYV